jgi:hypothetical protein
MTFINSARFLGINSCAYLILQFVNMHVKRAMVKSALFKFEVPTVKLL